MGKNKDKKGQKKKEILKAITKEEDTEEKMTNETHKTDVNQDENGQAGKIPGKWRR